MFKGYFILFLLAHILGDFYFQTEKMVKKKEENVKWVLVHGVCYWMIMLLVGLLTNSSTVKMALSIGALLHLVIEGLKYKCLFLLEKAKRRTQTLERNLFFIEQIIHLLCLITISYVLVIKDIAISTKKWLVGFFDVIGIDEMKVFAWILALFIIHKPANIIIQKLLVIYKPEIKRNEKKKDHNAGRFIGTVERIIMLIFISIGQYSAIGLVLTAKSIARYDQISKEKDFAEYYLLGTLISTFLVIVVAELL